MTDCAETRALLAELADQEDRARFEIRRLRPSERFALADACDRLAAKCRDPEIGQISGLEG